MKTRHWSFVMLALYAAINMLLVLIVGRYMAWDDGVKYDPMDYMGLAIAVAVVMFVAQALLFSLKVDVIEKRPEARRKITGTSIFIALLMAILTFCLFFTVFFVLFGEDEDNPLSHSGDAHLFWIFFVFIASWIFWGIVFVFMGRKRTTSIFIKQSMNIALRGSVLELLVAIPSHIIMRNRGDCCAPIFSFLGIITGLSVMLFAFGPAVLALFYYRMQAKRARKAKADLID